MADNNTYIEQEAKTISDRLVKEMPDKVGFVILMVNYEDAENVKLAHATNFPPEVVTRLIKEYVLSQQN